jgi:hypothetical protein
MADTIAPTTKSDAKINGNVTAVTYDGFCADIETPFVATSVLAYCPCS